MAQVQVAAIFWIREHDYQRFLELCVDRANLPQTYDKWLHAANKTLETLKRMS
jgi:hypothetical protein